jgi:cytochrome c-type biogenesis protein CcmH
MSHAFALMLALWTLGADAPVATDAPGPVAPENTLTQKDMAYRLGKNLRCPVCQGMSIAESPSTMAQDMMKRVRVMVKDGKSEQDVYDYFIERYGEWVMLDPASHGFATWVWLLPPLFVLGCVAMLVRWVRRLRAGKSPVAPTAAQGTAPRDGADDHFDEDAAGAAPDAYMKAIRDEVQR